VSKYNSHVKKVNTFKTAIGSNDGTLASGMIQSNKSKGGILKTIVLPNEDVNRLSLQTEELRQFIVSQKKMFEDTISAYQKDRAIRT
jgi:hypothetical protein